MRNTGKDNLPVLIAGPEFNKTIPKAAESVVFTDVKAPDGAALTDVSQAHDGSVVAWLDGTTYKVSTQEPEVKVYANPASSSMFNGSNYSDGNAACKNLTNIDVTNLDTSKVTNMDNMFYRAGYDASTFTIEGLNSWDTFKVTRMRFMFAYTGYNASTFALDLSDWDTSQVTDMSYMFYYAGRKASGWNIDCSLWNVNKVTNYLYFNGGVESKVTAPTWVN